MGDWAWPSFRVLHESAVPPPLGRWFHEPRARRRSDDPPARSEPASLTFPARHLIDPCGGQRYGTVRLPCCAPPVSGSLPWPAGTGWVGSIRESARPRRARAACACPRPSRVGPGGVAGGLQIERPQALVPAVLPSSIACCVLRWKIWLSGQPVGGRRPQAGVCRKVQAPERSANLPTANLLPVSPSRFAAGSCAACSSSGQPLASETSPSGVRNRTPDRKIPDEMKG
jgi:hypothetical protein